MKKNRNFIKTFAFLSLQAICSATFAIEYAVSEIKISKSTDESNVALFNSPITTFEDRTYISYVEKYGNRYRTVIKSIDKTNRIKSWVLEENNLNDPYHAQPSIGVDRDGYIHATYNMHSSPWQYSKSILPQNIEQWQFLGQNLDGPSDKLASTRILGKGTAAIPGNRITYQYMANDRNGQLYACFREATHNTKDVSYSDETWSLGLVKYSEKTKTWERLGISESPLATQAGQIALGCRIYFDTSNNLHLSWIWHVNYFNNGHSKPKIIAYATSSDGGKSFKNINSKALNLPIGLNADNHVLDSDFYESYTRVGVGPAVVILPSPDSKKRRSIVVKEGNQWSPPRPLPFGAVEILEVHSLNTNIIAISSGLRFHISTDQGKTWSHHDINISNYKYQFWVDHLYSRHHRGIRILAQENKTGKLSVFTINFPPTNYISRPGKPLIELN